jgi:hypothetical protein
MCVEDTLWNRSVLVRLHSSLYRIYISGTRQKAKPSGNLELTSVKGKEHYPTVVLANEARLADTAVL